MGETGKQTSRDGSCNCGAVRIATKGPPVRAGLCHCGTCRKETGGPFMAFGVWRDSDFAVLGETASWSAGTDKRHFCRACGSSLFSRADGTGEVEVRLGAFDDAPTELRPEYELWIVRRETWLRPVDGTRQYEGNRRSGPALVG